MTVFADVTHERKSGQEERMARILHGTEHLAASDGYCLKAPDRADPMDFLVCDDDKG